MMYIFGALAGGGCPVGCWVRLIRFPPWDPFVFRVVVKKWSDDSVFTLFGDADLGLGGFSYLRRLSLSWWSKSCFF